MLSGRLPDPQRTIARGPRTGREQCRGPVGEEGIMTRRRYTDAERAEALAVLAANGGAVEKTAAQLGIPEGTLENWANGRRHPEARQLAGDKKEAMADRLE